ncbi:MAG: hypothetical protein JWM98_2117 [Thermoleophilia bacterium]|nr:hypothetical protein [Thermoleophilia bacterium]
MSIPRDPIFDAVHAAFLPEPASEAAALARIRANAKHRLTTPPPAATPAQPTWLRPRGWTRARVLAVAIALVVLIGATVAAAQSGVIRRLFTSQTPSAQRMESLRVTDHPSGIEGPAADSVPADVEAALQQLAERPHGTGPAFGRLDPDFATRTLLSGRFGAKQVTVHARRTVDDRVCFAVSAGVEPTLLFSNCFDSFFDLEAPIHGSALLTAGSIHTVYGVAADEVTGIVVRTADGATSEALIGTNAYYWDTSVAGSPPVELVVQLEGGGTVTRPVDLTHGES